jgi:hypothetical protein
MGIIYRSDLSGGEKVVKKNSKKMINVIYLKDVSNTESLRLSNIAKTNKVSMDVIAKQFEEAKITLEKQGVKVNLERLAVNAVMNIYRRKKAFQNISRKKKETVTIYGFISGDRGTWDKAEQVRREVKKFIDQNGLQAALEAQMVDGDNNILDQRQKIYGRENPNYLKVLPPNLHILERTLFGFFRKNSDKTYKYGSIQTSDNRLARGWGKVKFYVPCQVTAIIKEETDDDIKLGSSSGEDTLSVFKAIKEDIDIKAIIDETLGEKVADETGVLYKKPIPEQWTAINKVEEFHEKYKDAWDRRIFVKGIVAWINTDRPTAYGAVKMGLMNPDNEDEIVIVEIPEQIGIDFGELSEIYVFGKTRRSKYYDENKKLVDGDVNIQATGIFTVVPTPREGQGYEGIKEDTPIEGWLD